MIPQAPRPLARFSVVALAVLAALLLAGGQARADTELRISSWVAPKHPVNFGGYEPYMKAVEAASDGRITFRLFSGGALLGAKATLAGISDGLADTGIVALSYHPAEFPYGLLIADLAMLASDPVVAGAAVTELNLLHCPPCLAEFAAQNMVYNGTYSTAPYVILGRRKAERPADLAGARIRTPGSVWDRWVAHVGGVPVNLPASDMYESLERGITDFVLQPIAALRSYSLWDVARNATLLDLGTYHSLSLLGYNRDTWRGLESWERRILLDQASVALIGASVGYRELDKEVVAESDSHPVEIIPATEELLADKARFIAEDLPRIADIARSEHGVADPEPVIATFKEMLVKWHAILDPLADDTDAMVAALRTEVFDKLDADAYGM